MTLAGWITMIISIGGVLTAAVLAYYKVLTTPKEIDKLASIELQTPDMEEK